MERLSLNESPAPAPRTPQQNQQFSQNALGPAGPQPTGGPPQLPPQMFTTAAQLLDLTDKKLVLILRDGRKLIGVLRSWDQFANLVFQDTMERIYAGNLYADVSRGIFIVRGENVLLLGEVVRSTPQLLNSQSPNPLLQGLWKLQDIPARNSANEFSIDLQDLDREDDIPPNLTRAPFEEVFALKKKEESKRKTGDKKRYDELQALGFEPEHSGEILF
ncbi:Ribonucleoprotein LSM domain eukaryotic/archaea-type [Penicillium vulpinum]|uniref:U6 snRNA-associated Sm-like protein LSm1 n=1 Tax=Penicillium vulpinum TaxID=29845 RepID=A0A1V6RT58_9EURO|nr:Ribonucleoprotein LSM domain eukaryotic/archaea-type [Penicillium vulpinum]KAJ5972968.1 Ribonucleoprotein LSM domain eukaryotic/archaea-type [Penicillium vulpinum]OQE04730.1 hypothetical protein PENVUL_c030G00366 [Penicillium vulpinum]